MYDDPMTDYNLQIRMDSETVNKIDQLSSKSRSKFVREAIHEKIKKELELKTEKKWIEKLKKHPQSSKESADWLKSESWEES